MARTPLVASAERAGGNKRAAAYADLDKANSTIGEAIAAEGLSDEIATLLEVVPYGVWVIR
ncbi:hypothetical protein [Streptomyces sp. SID161]|uniref:hypothetical protein n=1 Tax=Streptomyces sp. SID161 TaxID=2690251 RepID=UPI0013684200|nr:hypothetical protein [Streptomyces sp. SID161]MYW43737.1 hypothetical protein [Streptomyces sp. SID161]